ncbi:MAG: Cft2 family RNA processing exonuclease [Verrucomicrobiales bacterium]|jgi:Cft2 family RNA processing exonuclease
MIHFTNLAPANEIGGNSYLVEFGNCRVALDAGTHPKREGLETLPKLDLLDYDSLDGIFLTHAHLDHSGALPVMMREHPSARVFMSEATRELADAMLHNSVNVMTSKREELGDPSYPFYTHRELDKGFYRWEFPKTSKPFYFSDREEVTCEFHEAGHILGAVAPVFEWQGHRVLYTGDIHFEEQTLTVGAKLPEDGIDTVIVETTRGASPRDPDYTRAKEIQRLSDSISEILDRGGSVLMPVFAMGKTQELLLILHQLKESGQIPQHIPITIGGLSTKMTMIYDRLAGRANRNFPGFKILQEVKLIVGSKKKSNRQIEYQPGSIYAISSGMVTEKTASNELAGHFVSNPLSGILFVGYCDPDSPGGHLVAANQGDKIKLRKNSEAFELRCNVEKFDFSGHSPRDSILDYLCKVRPKNILLVHGDRDALEWFEAKLNQHLPDSRVIIPVPGERIELS